MSASYQDYVKSGLPWPVWFRQEVRKAHEEAVSPAVIDWLDHQADAIADAYDDDLFGSDEEGNHGSN